jgi:hypothetical protein
VDIETDAPVPNNLRSESRIPDSVKYELSDGYRLVFQRLPGRDKYLALTVGKHDHVDSFLDGHKGWVFSESGNLRELRLATIEDTIVEIVPGSAVEPDHVAPPRCLNHCQPPPSAL